MNSRVSMDCAILMVPDHADWMSQFVRECAPSGDRFRLHCVALDGTPWQPGTGPVSAADALRTCAMALRRYDVCLLPVTLSTLGWTRMALAVAEGVIDTPIVGITRDMTAAGLNDLLSLGLADFLRAPVCVEEFKIRLAQLAGAAGRAALAHRRSAAADELEQAELDAAEDASPAHLILTDGEPFRMAKARIVTEFERHYVSEMLSQHRGNISQAARAARKNRRAFWQLMRKHEIAADVYRASAVG